MVRGFWDKLKKPFFALAPMANVTDAAFRQVIAKYGRFTRPDGTPGGGPDVFFTEFVSCDGLLSKGREKLLADLWYTESEHPIVAQIFGSTPKHFTECAKLIRKLGFDGIDINMGCPDRAVEKQGGGAALIKNPKLAREIIWSAKEGSGGLPVSVKTRIGYNTDILEKWLEELFEAEPAAITIHARTRKEMSAVPAHWDRVKRAVELSQEIAEKRRPLIIGNGDVADISEARLKTKETGAGGIMIGRGIFGNPWLFSERPAASGISGEERLRVMIEHTFLFEKTFLGHRPPLKNFDIMKKHYKAYVSGWPGAKELRIKLMAAQDAREVAEVVRKEYPYV